jgi:ABC-type sugar transport system ATPase subunit
MDRDHGSRTATLPDPEGLLVVATSVSKEFGATQALRDASFELRPGEVHVLVGENGSGKSTLVKILSGVHSPDNGTIAIGGTVVQPPRNPKTAQGLGIVTVFQEVLVAEARSVLDNVWLGTDHFTRNRLSRREKKARANAAFEQLLGRPLSLDRPVEELSLSDRQACCIVRALVREPRVLILDEATSSLDVATRNHLFDVVSGLSASGSGVIFITHRMDEITEIGDRITVMRSGETVATLTREQSSPRELVRLMTGSDHLTEHARDEAEAPADRIRAEVFTVSGLQLRKGRRPFDVSIRSGELLGVAGLEGHGQDEFLDTLRGVKPSVGIVTAHRDGQTVSLKSVRQASRLGVAHVPRERRQASFAWMSIRENFGMPTLKLDTRYGWLRIAATTRRLSEFIDQLGIVLRSPSDPITTLSGGNQQKVVISRWLAARPGLLVLNDPTRGIDVGAKRDLYRLLTHLADQGMAVVMLSSELDEHIELMDRVLVFREHELFCVIPRDRLSRDALVAAFFGQRTDGDVDG